MIEAPKASSPAVRKSMQGNKRSNTKPEVIVRQLLREQGYSGYRLQWKKCPGHPDIAFPGRRIAIFVNGCFWHRCPKCNLGTPKSNTAYWEEKFRTNVARDARTRSALEEQGWKVVVIWECELKKKLQPRVGQYLYRYISLADSTPALDPAIKRISTQRHLRAKTVGKGR